MRERLNAKEKFGTPNFLADGTGLFVTFFDVDI
jgi:hypothetical protein